MCGRKAAVADRLRGAVRIGSGRLRHRRAIVVFGFRRGRCIVVPRFEFPLGIRQLGLKFGEFVNLLVEQGSVGEYLPQARLEGREAASFR